MNKIMEQETTTNIGEFIKRIAIELVWKQIEDPGNTRMRIDFSEETWILSREYKEQESWAELAVTARKTTNETYNSIRANFFLLILAAEGEL